ncbi:protein of unknown function [Methylorubrum extorquens DM4]|uniref:Uncharacterized protein n=2 Tax=Methylorubrum extorquens TaxID=408 RepID=C7C9M3_METED|nr:protein of unknown function [Methylorubrum extorquens DM4]
MHADAPKASLSALYGALRRSERQRPASREGGMSGLINGGRSDGFAILLERTHNHADGRASTLRDRHRDEIPSERVDERPERKPDDASGCCTQSEMPVRSTTPHSQLTLSMQHDHSDASTSPGCDSHDPIAYLVAPQNTPATQSRAGADMMVTLDGDDSALDVLAWCTANHCRAETVFVGQAHRRGTRCWKIVAGDDDAAFAFRLQWV